MDALDTLVNEHGLIRQFLDNLSLAGECIEEGRRPPREFFDQAIVFARTFADKFHHFKEEDMLFVRLAQRHGGEIDAQLEALKHQHVRGRTLVSGMAESIEGYAADDSARTSTLLESMAAYGSLLRHHIHTEDHVFFPLARKKLDGADKRELETEFLKIQGKYGGDMFQRSHKMVVDMGSMLTHLR